MRILLAEDERSLSRAVTALLERSKYSVDAVYDGEEALAYLETGNYDAVILDIMMPKVDGLTVLRTLRERNGNITLDQATYELSSPFGSFRLANREFQMMEMLLRNPRQIIPSERFLERIWGYESDVELGVVWAYISYLRKKLTALHADIQIRAARNVGYSLEAVS